MRRVVLVLRYETLPHSHQPLQIGDHRIGHVDLLLQADVVRSQLSSKQLKKTNLKLRKELDPVHAHLWGSTNSLFGPIPQVAQ